VAHWHDDAAMARADETARERNFHAARDQAAPYRDRLRLFKGGEVFPGVTAMPFPGHTRATAATWWRRGATAC
jgi:hypothetical protein